MNSLNKTFLPTINYKNRSWFIIDCKDQKLGRLATIIVSILKGKRKPHYYPGIDVGDNVCLLYTSPSPRDRQKSRMPSSA